MKTKLVAAALALLMAGGVASAEPTGLINSDRQLACKGRVDAENIAHSISPKQAGFSTVPEYLLELVLSGRCAPLAKGTKVFISSQGNGGETIAVRVPGETEYRYVDQYTVTVDRQELK